MIMNTSVQFLSQNLNNSWSRYDFFTRQQLQKEVMKRKLGTYQNSSKLRFRLDLIQDDISRGINPYISHDHNNSSPLDGRSFLPQSS